VIENKAGASFQLAMQAVTQAPADGYTLLHLISPMLSAQAVQKRYDVFKSLLPIVGLGATDTTFAVGGSSRFKTMQELIAFGKASPGKLSYGSPGIGTLEHLALAGFCKRYGIDAVHVPFKGGPEIVQALATGQIDLGTQAAPLVVQFAPKGLIRALVVLNHKRNAALPGVPTLNEAGLDINRLTLWGGLAAPVGTPRAVLDVLEAKALAAARDPALVKQYQTLGLDNEAQPAAAFGQEWKDDWGWISRSASENRIDTN
jgi:tripartite-type tricarboxylate transporter receptor subunit TctC